MLFMSTDKTNKRTKPYIEAACCLKKQNYRKGPKWGGVGSAPNIDTPDDWESRTLRQHDTGMPNHWDTGTVGGVGVPIYRNCVVIFSNMGPF